MSRVAKAICPWPWAVKEHGSPPRYWYELLDANGKEICMFNGPDARAKIEAVVELAAETAVKLREGKR